VPQRNAHQQTGEPLTEPRPATALHADNVLILGPWSEGEPAEIFPGCTLAFLIPWPGFVLDYRAWGQRLHAAEIPYALVLPHPRACDQREEADPLAFAAYFPLEDTSPCPRCFELRLLGLSRDVKRYARYLEALNGHDTLQYPSRPPTEEQVVMLKWLAMDITGADPGVGVFGAHDGNFTIHFFLPHPQCVFCSPWAGATQRDSATPQEWLQDARIGLLHRRPPENIPDTPLARSLASSEPAGPGAKVSAPTPYMPSPQDIFPETIWHGFGHDLDEIADSVAVLRGLARYASSARAGRAMWRGTRKGIPVSALDPRPWIPYAPKGRHPLIPYHEGREFDWHRAHSLARNDDVALPADLFFTAAPWEHLMHAEPAGTVAHPNIEIAVRVALCQTASVDGLMAHWYAQMVPGRISWDTLPRRFHPVLDEITGAGYQVAVVDLTTDIGVPTFGFLARSRHHDPAFAYGAGADLDPEVALDRAFTSFAEHVYAGGGAADWDDVDFLFGGDDRPLPPAHPDAHVHPIDTWRAYLRSAGLHAYWAQITPPDIAASGIVVVKVLIGHALPTIREDLGGRPISDRLLNLPRRLGLQPARLHELDLNPRPHPFLGCRNPAITR